MDEAAGDEMEVPLIRYNLNGIELNEEGFEKLSSEIALAPMAGNFPMPWGKERVQLYFGEVPLAGIARTDHRSKGFYPAIAARARKSAPRGARPITKFARMRGWWRLRGRSSRVLQGRAERSAGAVKTVPQGWKPQL